MKKRHCEEPVISILREAEFGTVSVEALCKCHRISAQTFSAGATARSDGRPYAR